MTLAFIRSLIHWQRATMAACAGSTPTGLVVLVDWEEAAVDRQVAIEWVDFLELVASGTEACLVEAKRQGHGESGDYANGCSMVASIREAKLHAEEHVASFGVAAATRRTESAQRRS